MKKRKKNTQIKLDHFNSNKAISKRVYAAFTTVKIGMEIENELH